MVLARPSDVKASDTKNKDGVNIDADEQGRARQAALFRGPPELRKPGGSGDDTCSQRGARTREGGSRNWNEAPP